MKAIDWLNQSVVRESSDGNVLTYSARRVLVGNCPDCNAPLVVFNDYESWPLIGCACGWSGDVPSLGDGVLYATDVPAAHVPGNA